ncbi:MAG: acyl-CoA thioester hydrolase [Acidobacteriota bacterium]|nr:acyl-CoA thioester hydrolase [Acidobacteriota bacterium]
MGVVHHANYIVWCELARTRLCLEAGFHYAEIEKRGLLLLVTGVHLTYRAPARYGDTVRAACWVERVGSRGVTFEYRIARSDAADPADPAATTLLASAATEHVWVDAGTRRPVRFPEELKAPFERFLPPGGSRAAAQPVD